MYYMPRFDPNITICGYADGVCVRNVERELQLKSNDSFTCKECYKACSSVHYDSVRHCIWQKKNCLHFFVFDIFVFSCIYVFAGIFICKNLQQNTIFDNEQACSKEYVLRACLLSKTIVSKSTEK